MKQNLDNRGANIFPVLLLYFIYMTSPRIEPKTVGTLFRHSCHLLSFIVLADRHCSPKAVYPGCLFSFFARKSPSKCYSLGVPEVSCRVHKQKKNTYTQQNVDSKSLPSFQLLPPPGEIPFHYYVSFAEVLN